ncbi:MAG: FAD-dependent thymidylate synthase [Desulfobacteraceae bacterium]|nr:FAD-dependent thymidylate synthase [Desulfobacteraceae bacterium]
MKIVEPYAQILNMPDEDFMLKHIEAAARTCYKSEDKIKDGSDVNLLRSLVKSGHHSVFEHISVSVKIVCDRGISHELVRHRICSFSQESTRYANYSKNKFGSEITVIRPFFWSEGSKEYKLWRRSMQEAENNYLKLLELGARPQEARSVLPNSLKTEIITTTNLRQWKHIFNLRCNKASHPQIRQIMLPLLEDFHNAFNVYYKDLYELFKNEIEEFKKIK